MEIYKFFSNQSPLAVPIPKNKTEKKRNKNGDKSNKGNFIGNEREFH